VDPRDRNDGTDPGGGVLAGFIQADLRLDNAAVGALVDASAG